jgi:uncharacterized protein YndB with AHSA1/START domain
MDISVTFHVAAPPDRVWALMGDPTTWSSLTASITSVEWIKGESTAVGNTAKVKQPGFPTAKWTVTEVVPERSFTWESRSPGIRSVGEHEVTPDGDGNGSHVRLAIRQTGLFAPLLALLAGKRSRRYVQMEADGLTQRAEAPVSH